MRSLVRLADMLEKRVKLAQKVRVALAYPLFMTLIGFGVVIFLMTYVIPSISKLFLETSRQLPWPTMALMAVSDFCRRYLLLIAIATVALIPVARAWIRTDTGRLRWDRLKLRLPLFGDLARKMAVSRFARTLGILVASGVPIIEAFRIVKDVAGNVVFGQAVEQVKDDVSRGEEHGGGVASRRVSADRAPHGRRRRGERQHRRRARPHRRRL